MKHILILTALLSVASCGSANHQRFYAPPVRSASQIARLLVDKSAPVYASDVDGRPIKVTFFHPAVVDVLPGLHQVTIRTNNGKSNIVPWQAEAGEVYVPGITSEVALGTTVFGDLMIFPKPEFKRKLHRAFP